MTYVKILVLQLYATTVIIVSPSLLQTGVLSQANHNRERMKRATLDRNCIDFPRSQWTKWGPCIEVNGNYAQIRWRTSKVPHLLGRIECQDEWDERVCSLRDLDNVQGSDLPYSMQYCDVTLWTTWSECYPYKGGKERERHRAPFYSVKGLLKCSDITSSLLVEYEECSSCFWTTWTPCYRYGAINNAVWERYRENKSKSKNLVCRGPWVIFQECEYCEWSPWKEWSSCYRYASKFERKRERNKTLSNSRHGKLCREMDEMKAEEYGECTSPQRYKLVVTSRGLLTPISTMKPRTTHITYKPSAEYIRI